MSRSSKIARVLHIKRHTKGTSNEISFSVLDARKSADSSEKPTRKAQGIGGLIAPLTPLNQDDPAPASRLNLPNPLSKHKSHAADNSSLGVVPATTSTTEKFDQEVARRKRKRLSLRLVSAIAASLLLVVGVGAGAYLFGNYMQQKSQDSQAIKSLTIHLDSFDKKYLFPVDKQAFLPLKDFDATQAQFSIKDKARAEKELKSITQTVQQTRNKIKGEQEQGLRDQVESALVSRETMYNKGIEILKLRLQVLEAEKELGQVWQLLLDSNKEIKASAHLVSQEKAEYEESDRKLNHAQEQLQDAQAHLKKLSAHTSWISLSQYQDYVNLRLRAVSCALESNKAAIDQNKKLAEEKNQEANKLEQEAATLATKFPDRPDDLILESADKPLRRLSESYLEARKKAATADSYLRDYFKQGSK